MKKMFNRSLDNAMLSNINLRNILITSLILIPVSLALFSAGISAGWPTIAVPKLEDESTSSNFHISQNDGILIINAIPVGAIVGSILSGLLLNVIGRKWFLYATSVPFIICWLLTCFANSWIEILAARLISGISVGALYSMAPLYIGELVEPRIRGASNTMLSFMFNLGCIFVFGLQPVLKREVRIIYFLKFFIEIVTIVVCIIVYLYDKMSLRISKRYQFSEKEKKKKTKLIYVFACQLATLCKFIYYALYIHDKFKMT